MSEFTHIPQSAQRRVRWRNGAGWTTEIAARPGGEFEWRLSVAEVDEDSEFSRFPGVDRTLLVISGPGMTLHVGDAPPVHLSPRRAHSFSGDLPARCTVTAPTRDFNCMTRRGAFSHALTLLGDPHIHRPARTTTAIYALDGRAELADQLLNSGDCLILEPAAADRPSLPVHGQATLVIVRLNRSP
jgi:environmental stress-induced protein Ves